MMEERGEVLIEDGPDSKRLRIALRTFKGTPLLDLRYWYRDKKTKNLMPSPRGISLTRANYLGMRSVAVDHHDAVMEFLDVGSIALAHQGDRDLVAGQHARQQQPINDIDVVIAALIPSSKLYEVNHEGSKATVTLNTNHMFFSELCESFSGDESWLKAIGKLLLALDFSLMNVRGNDLTSPNIIAEQLEFDLGKYAQRLSRVGK